MTLVFFPYAVSHLNTPSACCCSGRSVATEFTRLPEALVMWHTHVFSRLTLHRYSDSLAVLGRDGGRSHGYQSLSGRDGGHDAGLLLCLGDANSGSWCCGRGATSGGHTGLSDLRWVHKEAAPCHASGWGAVAVQQAGGRWGHTWPGDRRKIFDFLVSFTLTEFLQNIQHFNVTLYFFVNCFVFLSLQLHFC